MDRAGIIAKLPFLLALAVTPLAGATLERLSLDEMILKSTEIVRGRVLTSQAVRRGSIIYTRSTVQVVERWKGAPAANVQVSVPGGTLDGLRQTFSGAPKLENGVEYVLFLWTGSSGVTHVIGLSQGLFDLKLDNKGQTVVHRAASAARMLDPMTGREIQEEPTSMGLAELRARVERTLVAQRQ